MTELISLRFLRKDSTSYELRFGAYDSIKIVKQKVAEVSGIDVSKVQLMFAGGILSDEDKTLNDLKLTDGLTLHLFEGTAPPEPTITRANINIPTPVFSYIE